MPEFNREGVCREVQYMYEANYISAEDAGVAIVLTSFFKEQGEPDDDETDDH